MTAFQGEQQAIWLTASVRAELGKHLAAVHPHEACGVLLGAAAAGGMRIEEYIPMRNVAPDPLRMFIPDPAEWVRALYHQPAPVGLFHSHPHAPPYPSAADLAGLTAIDACFRVYLIGSPSPSGAHGFELNGYYISRKNSGDGQRQPSLIPAGLHALPK